MVANNNMPELGVRAIVKGADEYVITIGKMASTTSSASTKISDSTKKIATGGRGIQNLIGNVDELVSSILSLAGVGEVASISIGEWVAGLAAASAPLVALIAGIAALGVALVVLGQRSSEIEGVQNAFENLTATFGISADVLLNQLQTAANGTISTFRLMQITNNALSGSTDGLAKAFGERLPELLKIAQVQAAATGQSIDFLLESLVSGVRKGSALRIDNALIILSQTEAEESYAASIGKTVEALTDEERQIAILELTVQKGMAAIDAAGGVQETTAIRLSRISATFQNMWDKLAMAVKPAFDALVVGADMLLQFVTPAINTVIDLIGFLINVLVNAVGGIVNAITSWFAPVTERIGAFWAQITNPQFQIELARGAGRTMAAYAEGILYGLNTFVLPAILQVATAIANFLVGESPPPEGPLKKISEGGANVMASWMEGFSGVSLEPVSKVAADVIALMGNTATLSANQVETQMKRIERFLKPFENRVALLQSRFDALAGIANTAFDSIDRMQERLLDQLNAGDASAEARIRALDVERSKYQGLLDKQSEGLDMAKMQLANAQALVAFDKTALGIRKDQLGVTKDITKETVKPVAAGSPAAGKAPTGAAAPVTSPVGTTGANAIPPMDLGGTNQFDLIAQAFGEGFGESGQLGDTTELLGEIGDQFGRITPDAITERFTGFMEPLIESFQENLLNPFQEIIEQITFYFTGEGDFDGMALTTAIEDFVTGIPEFLSGVQDHLLNGLLTPFGTTVEDLRVLIFDVNTATSLAGMASNFFSGPASSSGTLAWILQQGVMAFTELPDLVATALSPFADLFYYAVVLPVIDGLNWMVDRFNFFAGQVNASIAPAKDYITQLTGIPLDALAVPTIDRITPPPPPSASAGFDARNGHHQWMGGLTEGPGAVRTDEKGKEGFILGPATRLATFPNEFLESLTDLRRILVEQVAAPAYSMGNSTTNTNHSQTNNITFNNSRSVNEGRRALSSLRIFKK